ncbi:MAG: PaaX family transcriptional regulator C-terminal domain-containing protein [Myxococcota bacterium]
MWPDVPSGERGEPDDASPRAFLMALLAAFEVDVPVQLLIRACSLFEIDENRTRVALHRLRTKGLIDSPERGTYRVTGNAEMLGETVGWREALGRLRPWEGRWIGLHTAPLPRADKTVARRRDRATAFVGLRELVPGLLVRPDNLVGGVERLRDRLHRLGLEPEAAMFSLTDLGPHEEVAHTLWQELQLDQRYEQNIAAMDDVEASLAQVSDDEGARQSFLAGNRAIQDIVLDPLLPAPLVDPELRQRFVDRMKAFDVVGRRAWARVLGTDLALRRAPAVEIR